MTEAPDFEALRAERNARVQASMKNLADEYGIPVGSMGSNFNPYKCYCACGSEPRGPCEHKWDGPDWTSEDGCACSSTCSRCGTTSMSHDMRYTP